ncbi:hypothetical protein ACFLZB_01770 [Nanoarchaeota archaeon]
MKIKKEIVILLVIFLLTFGTRLFLVLPAENFSANAYFDLRQVEHIKETGLPLYQDELSYGGRTLLFPPFFHYSLALFNIFLPLELVGKVIPNLMISCLVFVVYLIAKKLTKQKEAALFTAFISGFVPVIFAKTIFSVSIYCLILPLMFLGLYSLMNIDKKKYVYLSILIIVVLSLTSSMAVLLILGLLVYLVFSEVEILKRNRSETELIIFATFVFFWIQFLFYKNAFLSHGLALVWRNIPDQLLAQQFSSISIFSALIQIGFIPFICGIFIIYKYVLKEKNKYIYMYVSLAMVVTLLLWLRLIDPVMGLMFLGLSLTILFAQFFKMFFDYLKRTKFNRFKTGIIVVMVGIFVLTSVWPSFSYASDERDNLVSDELIQALQWLSKETPKDSTILGNLREGYLITAVAQRKNVMDTNFLLIGDSNEIFDDVELIYSTTHQIQAVDLLNKYDVDYIIISNYTKNFYDIESLDYEEESCIKIAYKTSKIKIFKTTCKIEENVFG